MVRAWIGIVQDEQHKKREEQKNNRNTVAQSKVKKIAVTFTCAGKSAYIPWPNEMKTLLLN